MNEIVPIILAAGKGARLGLEDIPKPMVPVSERPLMQTAVEALFKLGFGPSEIKAVIGYRGEKIQAFFGKDLDYLVQKELNGNAGALGVGVNGLERLEDKHILAIQGDDADQATVENLRNLISLHLGNNADLSLLTVSNPDETAHRKEYLYIDRQVVNMVPRKSIDSNGRYTGGIYLFSGSFLSTFLPRLKEKTPEGAEMGISELTKTAINEGLRVFQFCSPKEYISVNTPEGLQILRNRKS